MITYVQRAFAKNVTAHFVRRNTLRDAQVSRFRVISHICGAPRCCAAVCLNCFYYIIGDQPTLGNPEIWYTFVLFFIS